MLLVPVAGRLSYPLAFPGLALSRIGLWAFDVVQLTQLQMALAEHPRRNALTGLQFALQNMFDLAHYGLTIGWSSPGQFKYPATVGDPSPFTYHPIYSTPVLGLLWLCGFRVYSLCIWLCTAPAGSCCAS